MIIVNNLGKYRPGEDEIRDQDIVLFSNFAHDNYIPSREEILKDDLTE